jgi:hypothetical protein
MDLTSRTPQTFDTTIIVTPGPRLTQAEGIKAANATVSAARTFFPALYVLHAQLKAVGIVISGMSVRMGCKVAAKILQAMVVGGKP